MKALLFLASWLFATLAATFAFAADLTRYQVEQISFDEMFAGTCTHRLEGEIVVGDAERFRRELASLPEQLQDDRNWVLCLDSPGGNLGEALEIGRLIGSAETAQNIFSTYVPEGATCLSACAVLFMHGVAAWHNSLTNFRMMHPTAQVGFHAPRLSLAGGADTQVPLSRVTEAYSAAMRHTAELAERASQRAWDSEIPVIPLTLLARMLAHEGDDMFYITLLHHAFLWDIRIQGQENAIGPDFDLARGYMQICENALYGEIGGPKVEEVPEPAEWICDSGGVWGWAFEGGEVPAGCTPFRPGGQPDIPDGHLVLTIDTMNTDRCSLGSDDGEHFDVRRYGYETQQLQKYLTKVHMLPPSTPITTLAR